MRGRFEYQKLRRSHREIRLLELLPSSHHLSKFRPACRIFHSSLNESLPFEALSYVWGDERDKRVVLVDKRPFRVTRNLFDAMMSLGGGESKMLWVDAICINQLDDEEKGWQVGLMGRLYEKAFAVPAWLGPPADDSDIVIDYMDMLGKHAEICGLHDFPELSMQVWQSITTVSSFMDDHTKIELTFWLDGNLLQVSRHDLQCLLDFISGRKSQDQRLPVAALNHLFRRPWWGRVWVLQEITLPDRAYFACGTKRIPRRRFRAAFNAYYALWHILTVKVQRQQALTPYEGEVCLMAAHRAHVMLSMSNVHRTGEFPLVALLRATCVGSIHHLRQDGYQHLESTNPRDKVFALLGLADDQEELETLGVFPDYKTSTAEVYTATMAALLQQKHISMLSICRVSGVQTDLPSWVPDWSGPLPETLQDVERDHLTLYPTFNACGLEHQSQVTVSKQQRGLIKLSLRAAIYDEVFQVGGVIRISATGTCMFPVLWLYELLRLTYVARNIYKDFERRLRAVIRTSHAATGYGEDASLQKVDLFLDALPIFKGAIRAVSLTDMRQDLQRFFASSECKNALRQRKANPSRLEFELARISPGRVPFVTKKGHLGLTSRWVERGDIISLIGGAQVPFVLRDCKNGRYSIISEAYVDGIMDGEVAASSRWEYIELV